MKVWEVIGLKENTTAGGIATVAMPLFTGKKGKAHKKAALNAVGLESDAQNPKHPVYNKMIRRNP
tara:strand:+ start:881 stop:1075 length:195 start_codon:yes stop_codon:yes gene_type:complete